jgi:N-acetyl-gamma-glutamyl-phosphate reductase
MIRAMIFGATGYTGVELIRLLSGHPDVTVVGGTSRNWAGKTASAVFPFVSAKKDFFLYDAEDLDPKVTADVAFLALPHGQSAATALPLLDAGTKVVDLSADLRLHDAQVYEEWYGEHKAPELLPLAVYGLPEIHRDRIRGANLIANPGCYPTTAILGTAPLVNVAEVDTSCPIVDAKSGISGAGRGAKLNTSFCEAGEGFKPYGVIRHRHIPEMEQELSALAGSEVRVRFTPHLIPASRGMVSTIYLPLKTDVSTEELRQAYVDFYTAEPFVRILPQGTFPDTAMVKGSNQCHIAIETDSRTGWAVVMVAIDNLVKGASGVAVQNMNLIMGLEETAGLTGLSLFP